VVGKPFIKKYLKARKYNSKLIDDLFEKRPQGMTGLSSNMISKIRAKEKIMMMNTFENLNPGLLDRKRERPEVTINSIVNGECYDFQGNKLIDEESKINIEEEVNKACDGLKIRKSFVKKSTFINNLVHKKNLDLIMNRTFRSKENFIEDIKLGLPVEYLEALYENGHDEFIQLPIPIWPKNYLLFKNLLHKKLKKMFIEVDSMRLNEPHIEQNNRIQFDNKFDNATLFIYDPKFKKLREKYKTEFAYFKGTLDNPQQVIRCHKKAEKDALRAKRDMKGIRFTKIKLLESIEKSYEFANKYDSYQRKLFNIKRKSNLKKELIEQKESVTKNEILNKIKDKATILEENELTRGEKDESNESRSTLAHSRSRFSETSVYNGYRLKREQQQINIPYIDYENDFYAGKNI
jgi:hypothetical protein